MTRASTAVCTRPADVRLLFILAHRMGETTQPMMRSMRRRASRDETKCQSIVLAMLYASSIYSLVIALKRMRLGFLRPRYPATNAPIDSPSRSSSEAM